MAVILRGGLWIISGSNAAVSVHPWENKRLGKWVQVVPFPLPVIAASPMNDSLLLCPSPSSQTNKK